MCVAVMLQELSIKFVLINNGIGMVSSQPHTPHTGYQDLDFGG